MKIRENMNIFTIRKKILLASKLMGVILIVSYILSHELPISKDLSFVTVSYTHLFCKDCTKKTGLIFGSAL